MKVTTVNQFAANQFAANQSAANQSAYTIARLVQRLNLGRVMEGTYGAGVMTEDDKPSAQKTGWTTDQLLAMSAAKSFYN